MSTSKKCPKCGFKANSAFNECPRCGVIISKFRQRAEAGNQAERRSAADKSAYLADLAGANTLIIRQKKEWGEILTGFETKNRYEVSDHLNNPLMEALEEEGSALTVVTRLLLKALRPFTMHLFSPQGTGLFKLTRPFRFYFHELAVCRSNGVPYCAEYTRLSIATAMNCINSSVPCCIPGLSRFKKADRSWGK
jgi:hypothetical protein